MQFSQRRTARNDCATGGDAAVALRRTMLRRRGVSARTAQWRRQRGRLQFRTKNVESEGVQRQECLCYSMTYYERNLPHWHPEGESIFVTWRLFGSLPRAVLARIKKQRDDSGKQFVVLDECLDSGKCGPLWLLDQEIAGYVHEALIRGAELGRTFCMLGSLCRITCTCLWNRLCLCNGL